MLIFGEFLGGDNLEANCLVGEAYESAYSSYSGISSNWLSLETNFVVLLCWSTGVVKPTEGSERLVGPIPIRDISVS